VQAGALQQSEKQATLIFVLHSILYTILTERVPIVARSYDISLLPALQEQLAFFKAQSYELLGFCEAEYGKFLAAVDAQSSATEDQETIDNLEDIYEFASERLEALKVMMTDEISALEDFEKSLSKVALTGNLSLWADVSTEMIEDADFKTNAAEFIDWATTEMEGLKSSVVDVLTDWQAAIQEGNSAELAKFIEALDDMEAEDADFEDQCCDNEECDSTDCESDECETDDECCGKQDPCCRTSDEEDEEA